jgi:hypothetical protein
MIRNDSLTAHGLKLLLEWTMNDLVEEPYTMNKNRVSRRVAAVAACSSPGAIDTGLHPSEEKPWIKIDLPIFDPCLPRSWSLVRPAGTTGSGTHSRSSAAHLRRTGALARE